MRRPTNLSRTFFFLYEANLAKYPVILGLKDIAYELTEAEWTEKHGSRFYKSRMSFAVQYHYFKNPTKRKNNYIRVKERAKYPIYEDEPDPIQRRECKSLWPKFEIAV